MANRNNDKDGVKIAGTSKDDYIYNSGNYVTITSGAGNDLIESAGSNVSIDAGDGDDYITVQDGNNVTVSGGKGNDYVMVDWGEAIAYVYSGGNDAIYNFDIFDTLVLGSVKVNSSVRADSTVTLNLSNKKTLRLEEYWFDKINIVKSVKDVKNWNIIRNADSKTNVKGTSKDDYIYNTGFNATIEGGKGNDYVDGWGVGTVYIYSGGNDTINNFDNLDTLVLGSVKVNSSVRADDTVILNLSNKKTLTLTDYQSDKINVVKSASKAKTWNDINNYESGTNVKGTSKDDYIYNRGSNVTIEGGKGNDYVNLGGNVNIYVYSGGNDTLNDFGMLDSIVLGSVKVNSSVRADSNVILSLSNKKTLTLTDPWADNITIVKSIKDAKNWNLIINEEYNTSVKGTSKEDYIFNSGQNVTITSSNGDDSIGNGNSNVSINSGAGNDTVDNWGGNNVSIQAGAGNDFIRSENSYVTIDGGAGNDTIDNYCGNGITIRGGAGNDSINDRFDSILDRFEPESLFDGGDGKDTINVFSMLATVTGGKGNDKILLNSTSNLINYKSGEGNDTIYGFNSTDSLSISGGKYSTTAIGDDIIVTVGKSNITLKDVKGNAVYINNKNIGGKGTDKKLIVLTSGDDKLNNDLDGATISGGKGNDSINNYFGDKVSINAGAGNDSIWSSARVEWNSATNSLDTLDSPDNVTIDAGDGNDYIYNLTSNKVSISGGKGNDSIRNLGNNTTLNGGKGNDSLWGDKGAETFIYAKGDGKDIIFGFDDNDTLTFDNIEFTSSYKNEAVTFKVNGGSVTLKEFTATTFHINDETYKISGSKLVKK